MPRKGENIYKRKDGRWEARYIKSHDNLGKANYGYVYGKSYREAKQKRQNALINLKNSSDTEKKRISSYKSRIEALSDDWLASVKPQIKQSTFNKYSNLLDSYILPYLGNVNIDTLSVDKLYECCNYLLQRGGGKRKRGFCKNSVGCIIAYQKDYLLCRKPGVQHAMYRQRVVY